MKIVLDAYGGDNAPLEIIRGGIDAIKEDKDLEIIIVGKREELLPLIGSEYDGDKISVVDAREVITNEDIPTKAVREKSDSSMVKAIQLIKDNPDYAGVVSSGSTGALLTCSLLMLRRIKGISRPALVPLGPTIVEGKRVALVDCGANADCKPINLCHFAILGTCFIRAIYKNIPSPTVALLSNGTEKGKGNELVKETYPMLTGIKGINFVGNIEARDMLTGEYDVIVADGFSGNIALKANEGMAKSILYLLKDGIKNSGIRGMLGALCLKPVLKKIKKLMDVNEQAGGAFLGVNGIVVKAHGSSTRVSIKACIEQVKLLYNNDIVNSIKDGLQEFEEIKGSVEE